MKKAIKSYFKYGEHCGVAGQVEGSEWFKKKVEDEDKIQCTTGG